MLRSFSIADRESDRESDLNDRGNQDHGPDRQAGMSSMCRACDIQMNARFVADQKQYDKYT